MSTNTHKILQGRIVGELGCNTLIDNSLRIYTTDCDHTLSFVHNT